MKTLLKILGYGLAVAVTLVGVLAATVFIRSNAVLKKTHAVPLATVTVPTDAAAIARGKHLATTRGCLDCHGADLGGALVFENAAMGRLHGPNLTRGTGGLPPSYGDAEIARAIRHGVGADGRGLFLMPSIDYVNLTEEDMGALLAYIKAAPPVDRPRGPVSPGPVARGLVAFGKIKLAADEIDHANVKPAVVTAAVSADYGRYVAASCIGCHGPNLSGGKIAIGPPEWPPAANLTPHADAAIAKWSEADFAAALRTGKRPDGTEISPVMPRVYAQLEEIEVKALWTFLRTLPPTATGALGKARSRTTAVRRADRRFSSRRRGFPQT